MIEITEVLPTSGGEHINWVDLPRAGQALPEFGVTLIGWSAGAEPISSFELARGHALLRCMRPQERRDVATVLQLSEGPASDIGFSTGVPLLGVAGPFELNVSATIESSRRVDVARVRGRREPPRWGLAPARQPLLVTGVGRSGSTVLMAMLAAHPEIVVHPVFPYEARCATYWVHAAQVLCERGPTATASDWLTRYQDWGNVKANPLFFEPYAGPDMVDWFHTDHAHRALSFCIGSIDDFYSRAAEQQGKGPATAFAEKQHPWPGTGAILELMPGTTELFIVRDPRDHLASFTDFARRHRAVQRSTDTSIEAIARDLAPDIARLVDAYRQRGDRGLLIRYEELMAHPYEVAGRILRRAGLDHSSATVDACVVAAMDETPQVAQHRTSRRGASVGRWREDLDASMVAMVDELFAEARSTFGYA